MKNFNGYGEMSDWGRENASGCFSGYIDGTPATIQYKNLPRLADADEMMGVGY